MEIKIDESKYKTHAHIEKRANEKENAKIKSEWNHLTKACYSTQLNTYKNTFKYYDDIVIV